MYLYYTAVHNMKSFSRVMKNVKMICFNNREKRREGFVENTIYDLFVKYQNKIVAYKYVIKLLSASSRVFVIYDNEMCRYFRLI